MLLCAYGPPSRIKGGLYQAGYPLGSPSREGFDVVVLCAKEFQPEPERYLGTRVIYAPMNDVALTPEIAGTAHAAASEALDLYRQGASVLVTCAWGKNRSGLVTGLMLVGEGYSGDEAVRLIRAKRPGALFNESFAEYLRGL